MTCPCMDLITFTLALIPPPLFWSSLTFPFPVSFCTPYFYVLFYFILYFIMWEIAWTLVFETVAYFIYMLMFKLSLPIQAHNSPLQTVVREAKESSKALNNMSCNFSYKQMETYFKENLYRFQRNEFQTWWHFNLSYFSFCSPVVLDTALIKGSSRPWLT